MRVLDRWKRARVGLLVVLSFLFLSSISVPAHATPVAWQAADGTWQQGEAGLVAVDAFLHRRGYQREKTCHALVADLESRIDRDFAVLFARFERRVPDFAEWVFDWETSYARYYDLIKFTLGEFYDNATNYDLSVDFEEVRGWIKEELISNFNQIVIDPDVTGRAFASLTQALEQTAGAQMAASRAEEQLRLAGFIAHEVVPNGNPAAGPEGAAVLGSLAAGPDPDTFHFRGSLPAVESAFLLDDEMTDSMLMRSPRLILARFVGLGLRIAAGVSVWKVAHEIADTADIGIYGYVPGLLVGFGVAIGTAWGVDYGLTMTDELLNRPQYEERLRVLLDRLERELELTWGRGMRQLVLPECLGTEAVAASPP